MTKVADLTLSSIVFHIDGGRVRKRPIKSFDLEKGQIVLGGNRQTEYCNTFVFSHINDSSLKLYGDIGRTSPPCVFFSHEEALQGLIVILEKFIKDDEEEIEWRNRSIAKSKKRLNLLKNS